MVVSLTLTRRLRSLSKAATRYAGGDARFDTASRGRDEIGELSRAVHDMAHEIEARNAYNREFIRTTTHELRTPLTAIGGAAELLEQGAAEDPAARRKFIANIRHDAERMTRLVGELRELTRVDTESLRGQKEETAYAAFVREAVARLAPTFPEPHAKLTVDVPEKNLVLNIVPGRIEQVLANLLENAFRYTPPEGKVTVRVETADGKTVTSVCDTGCGIPASHLDRVFDRFFTTESRHQPRDYGSGLGLAIAHRIVANHSGRLWVTSEQGHGATFSFELP